MTAKRPAHFPSPETVERIRRFHERTLSPDEVRAWSEAPITDEERESVLALHRWFCRRYPTALERLQYVRKAYVRWKASRIGQESADDTEGR